MPVPSIGIPPLWKGRGADDGGHRSNFQGADDGNNALPGLGLQFTNI